MEFIQTNLEGVVLIQPKVFNDPRGFFLESYSFERFSEAGIAEVFVQDNHSLSVTKGVVRGLHFQLPPFAQSKLVRVIRGAIYDVVVDLRKNSPSYGKWSGFELSAEAFSMLFVPRGFAHGFCTIEDSTEVLYKVDNTYSPSHDSGIRWNDSDLAIKWPTETPLVSAKDQALSFFKELESPF